MVFDQLQNGFFEFTGLKPEAVFPDIDDVDYVNRVIPRIGYDIRSISPAIRDRITANVRTAREAVEMGGMVRLTTVDAWESGKISGDGLEIDSAHWARVVSRMTSPRRIVCFLLTLGESIDRIRKDKPLFEAYVLDGFGSEMIETAAQKAEQRIIAWAASNNMACCRRFSPGYCDWPLASGQKAVFGFLKPDAIGVRALVTGAMRPTKSVSAVMITADQVPLICPCRFCGKKECDHRRI